MTKAELVREMAAAVCEQREADRIAHEATMLELRAELHELRELVKAIPVPNDGKDGKDADPAAIVQEVLAQIHVPEDGRDGVDGKDGADGMDAEVDVDEIVKAVLPLIPIPENGKDGAPGKDAEPIDRVTLAKDVLALIPIPKDGKDGIASRDEIRAEIAKAVAEFTGPEVEKRVQETFDSLPVNIYRGVYREGVQYKAGNTATWAGSLWHANTDTTEKPGEGQPAWTLAVKRGSNGKDADVAAIVKEATARLAKTAAMKGVK